MEAWLYDTRSSARTKVVLRFEGGKLWVESAQSRDSYDLDTLSFSSRLGNTPRSIYLPDDRVCETQENDVIDAVLKDNGVGRGNSLLHFLESKFRYLVAAVVVIGAFSYFFVAYGLPSLAKQTARKLPASVVYQLDASTLATLDKTLLKPSALPKERQEELKCYFLHYIDSTQEWPKVKIFFRSAPEVGANAFALPDGSIVFTDDLISLAKDDRELLSIFFHELGHVQKRHALQTILQDSAFYLLLSAITGDVTAAGSAFAVLPTMLVESSYSRDMEVEADDYTYEMMRVRHIEHKHFAAIMSRLMKQTHESNSSALSYLSDHPSSQLRIDRFKEGKPE